MIPNVTNAILNYHFSLLIRRNFSKVEVVPETLIGLLCITKFCYKQSCYMNIHTDYQTKPDTLTGRLEHLGYQCIYDRCEEFTTLRFVPVSKNEEKTSYASETDAITLPEKSVKI